MPDSGSFARRALASKSLSSRKTPKRKNCASCSSNTSRKPRCSRTPCRNKPPKRRPTPTINRRSPTSGRRAPISKNLSARIDAMLSRTSVPLLLAATLSLAACSSEKPGGQPLTPVNAVAVENYAAGEGPRYSATIAPYAQVSLAFKSSGYVTKILQVHGADGKMRNADPGDWITGGQVLATVREDDYRNNVARLTASLAQAN